MMRTVIVEDDVMVASINEKFASTIPGVAVVGSFQTGAEALEFFARETADLVLLDVYLPDMSGMELLKLLRDQRCRAGVIMVTAANDVSHLEEALRLGATDYLIKPFRYERFEAAVRRFALQCEMMARSDAFTQDDIDHLMSSFPSSVPEGNRLQKGILPQTLESVRNCLKAHSGDYLTSETIAREINMSKVTARRYLNYLIECNEAIYRINYLTGGRPSKEYRWSGL